MAESLLDKFASLKPDESEHVPRAPSSGFARVIRRKSSISAVQINRFGERIRSMSSASVSEFETTHHKSTD